ncbi:MAG: LysM peptidoglycan-binding domain-containing protein [Phycisphaerales bacterium]|nr:LysM peptidoglycan-binding domain-containing protein [Phycisphaerales bacterium]
MTRENKLAMVVGFGLLLFVGILVSDHFSTAQRQALPNLLNQDQTRVRVTPPVSIAAVPLTGATVVQATKVITKPVSSEARSASNEHHLLQDNSVANPNVRPISNDPNAVKNAVIAVVANAKAGKTQEGNSGIVLHPVAEGETLYSICAKTYGDCSLWKELAEYNKKALPNAAKLRKGVMLQLPPVEQLRHGAVLAATIKGARVSVTTRDQDNSSLNGKSNSNLLPEIPLLATADVTSVDMRPPVIGALLEVVQVDTIKNKSLAKNFATKVSANENDSSISGDIYIVQKGDTLGAIAKKKLGKSSKWTEIASANGATLSDPTALSPGMSLRLPKTN